MREAVLSNGCVSIAMDMLAMTQSKRADSSLCEKDGWHASVTVIGESVCENVACR